MYLIALFSILSICLTQSNQITIVFGNENSKLVRFELDLVKELINRYAESSNLKIKQKYKGVKIFDDHFRFIDEATDDNILSIDGISILASRKLKYDFSTPYMVNKYALIGRKDYLLKSDSKNIKVAFQIGTIYEQTIETISNLFPIIPVPHRSAKRSTNSLKNKKVDLIYTDFVDSWSFNLKVVKVIKPNHKDEYGMLFKKGSRLKISLNKIYNDFIKTAEYKKMINKHFGIHVNTFFKS